MAWDRDGVWGPNATDSGVAFPDSLIRVNIRQCNMQRDPFFVSIDQMTTGHRGHGVDWPSMWAYSAGFDPSLPPRQAGTYWDDVAGETGGLAPTTMLAFVHRAQREAIARSAMTDRDTLNRLVGDPDPIVATAARATLGAR